MSRKSILALACCVALFSTACSKPPVQNQKFANREAFNTYIDSIDIPEAWQTLLKRETRNVSGKYLNNMVPYLELEGEPVTALLARYGMEADISIYGVDPGPAIQKAARDLIEAGDRKNLYKNDRWLLTENLNGGQWSEGQNAFQQAAEFRKQRTGQKRAASDVDFSDVQNR